VDVTRDDVLRARERIAPVVRETPVFSSDNLSRLAGRAVQLKPEHLQRTGSFKIRGAYNRIAELAPGTRVVAASAGNHAQGVALAASLRGCPATVFMPSTVPFPKLAATRGYGADVVLVDGGVEEAVAAARTADGVFIHPFDDPLVIAGQGTIGLELLDEISPDTTVVVPIGGGGLIGGIGAALDGSGVRLVGVEAIGAAAMADSLVAGMAVTLDRVQTMADGIAVKAPSELTLELAQRHLTDVVTVGEEDISRAVILLLERAKAVVEPAGAVGLAAVLAGKIAGDGPVAVLLSGGNVDPMLLGRLIDHGLTASGRFLVLRIVLADKPGSLAHLSAEIARLKVNVLSIEHHREGVGLAVADAEVRVTLETRDHDHQREVVEALQQAGIQATVA
jgi:threonine dehydratase